MLRERTGTLHARAEDIVARAGFFDGLAGYRDYLRRMHEFYRGVVQAAGDGGLEELRRWRITDRIDWLAGDLANLGVTPVPSGTYGATPLTLGDQTRLLGALYVMVGSTLGARVLVRSTYQIETPSERGKGYFSGLAADGSWPAFLDHLERAAVTSDGELESGACSTFGSVVEHLSGVSK